MTTPDTAHSSKASAFAAFAVAKIIVVVLALGLAALFALYQSWWQWLIAGGLLLGIAAATTLANALSARSAPSTSYVVVTSASVLVALLLPRVIAGTLTAPFVVGTAAAAIAVTTTWWIGLRRRHED